MNYNQISTLSDIYIEKARLYRKIQKQEKRLARDWERIEDSWQIFGKIARIGNRLLSSASLLASIDLGYKIASHFFLKKK